MKIKERKIKMKFRSYFSVSQWNDTVCRLFFVFLSLAKINRKKRCLLAIHFFFSHPSGKNDTSFALGTVTDYRHVRCSSWCQFLPLCDTITNTSDKVEFCRHVFTHIIREMKIKGEKMAVWYENYKTKCDVKSFIRVCSRQNTIC